MALQTGNWTFNGAGSAGNFSVTSSDAQGNVQGTLDGNPIQGFFDSTAQTFAFMSVNPNDGSIQVFTGNLFSSVAIDFVRDTLIGTVNTYFGSGPQVQVSTDGWYATIGHVIT